MLTYFSSGYSVALLNLSVNSFSMFEFIYSESLSGATKLKPHFEKYNVWSSYCWRDHGGRESQ